MAKRKTKHKRKYTILFRNRHQLILLTDISTLLQSKFKILKKITIKSITTVALVEQELPTLPKHLKLFCSMFCFLCSDSQISFAIFVISSFCFLLAITQLMEISMFFQQNNLIQGSQWMKRV